MRFTFTEKRVNVSEDLTAYAEKKISKLEKYFKSESDAYVTFSAERGRFIAEVTVKNNGMFYRVKESTGDMFASIDSAVASIERQIRKNKTRLEKRLREGAFDTGAPEYVSVEPEIEEEYQLIRTKKFVFKPMSPEEAILQMNLLGHNFFAFKNQEEDDAFAVVYKRKDGGYGMIESGE